MARLLTLAVLAGLGALLATSSAQAVEDQPAAAGKAAITSAPAVAAAPAPAAPTTTRMAAPRRTYRSYSYNPTTIGGTRGARSRSYQGGVRDAASKVLGVYQPFYR